MAQELLGQTIDALKLLKDNTFNWRFKKNQIEFIYSLLRFILLITYTIFSSMTYGITIYSLKNYEGTGAVLVAQR